MMYDAFESEELHRFVQIYNLQFDETITGCEPVPGEMLTPKRLRVDLPDNIYDLLVQYYNDAYDDEFTTIAELVSKRSTSNMRPIVVRLMVNQFGRMRIGATIFVFNIN